MAGTFFAGVAIAVFFFFFFFFFFLIERLILLKYTNTSRILIYTHRFAMRYMCLVDDYLNNS